MKSRRKEIRENKDRLLQLLQNSSPMKTGSIGRMLDIKPYRLGRILNFLWGCGAIRYSKRGWVAVPIDERVNNNMRLALEKKEESVDVQK